MNDTHPKIAQLVCQMIQQKTPEEHLMMSSSMHATSKSLIINALIRNKPNISLANLRQELFLKFYGDDFPPEQRKKILKHLANKTSQNSGWFEYKKPRVQVT
jgi:uncharacterized protein (DUF362 family)